jgi:hypothetical protein
MNGVKMFTLPTENSFSKIIENQGVFFAAFSKNFLLSAILRIQEKILTKFSKIKLNFEQLFKKLHQD